MSTIHKSKYGTYHPDPTDEVAWAVNDTRGYIDEGPDCDGCGAENLSFAYVCLDGGDALCEACSDKDGTVNVIPCNCK